MKIITTSSDLLDALDRVHLPKKMPPTCCISANKVMQQVTLEVMNQDVHVSYVLAAAVKDEGFCAVSYKKLIKALNQFCIIVSLSLDGDSLVIKNESREGHQIALSLQDFPLWKGIEHHLDTTFVSSTLVETTCSTCGHKDARDEERTFLVSEIRKQTADLPASTFANMVEEVWHGRGEKKDEKHFVRHVIIPKEKSPFSCVGLSGDIGMKAQFSDLPEKEFWFYDLFLPASSVSAIRLLSGMGGDVHLEADLYVHEQIMCDSTPVVSTPFIGEAQLTLCAGSLTLTLPLTPTVEFPNYEPVFNSPSPYVTFECATQELRQAVEAVFLTVNESKQELMYLSLFGEDLCKDRLRIQASFDEFEPETLIDIPCENVEWIHPTRLPQGATFILDPGLLRRCLNAFSTPSLRLSLQGSYQPLLFEARGGDHALSVLLMPMKKDQKG